MGLYPEGTNLSGYFVPEAWMFAPMSKAGASFPPALPPEAWETHIGVRWRSEGHLATLLASKLGPRACTHAFERHWEEYATPEATLRSMTERGIRKLRIPVPWYMFPAPPSHGFTQLNGLVADPFARELAVFPLLDPHRWLRPWLEEAARVKIEILLTLHSLPGYTGPGFALMSMAMTTVQLSLNHRDMWLEAYAHIIRNLLTFVVELSPEIKPVVTGIQPWNMGLQMDADSFALPALKGRYEVARVARRMSDLTMQLLYRDFAEQFAPAALPALYLNLDHTMETPDAHDYLRSAAGWMQSRGIVPAEKLVHALHLFVIDWGQLFVMPTPEHVSEWAQKKLALAAGGPLKDGRSAWRVSCVEWSAAPPRSDIFQTRAERRRSFLPRKWPEGIFRGFVQAFHRMGIESFFWGWDMPYACAFPIVPGQNRMFWSLKCIPRNVKDASRRPS